MELKINVTDEVNDAMVRLKNKEIKWVILKPDDKKENCLVDVEGDINSDYEHFKDAFPDSQPRWAAYDLHIVKPDNSTANKIVFYSYVPDTYSGMDRLFYPGAKEYLTKQFDGISRSIQVN